MKKAPALLRRGHELRRNLGEKTKEAVISVAPITAIVLILHFTIAPLPLGLLALFLVGALLLVLGMGLFTLGADLSMMPMGEAVGAELIKSRKLVLLIVSSLVMGIVITIAEPDLQVLANQIPSVPNMTLIMAVAVGVGIFLVTALLRIVFRLRLNFLLIGLYIVVFGIAAFASDTLLSVAFDSGGVTTGPITVPFILALGIGVSAVRGGKDAHDDSFGLVAVCSVGPILAVLLLDILTGGGDATIEAIVPSDIHTFRELVAVFLDVEHGFPYELKQVATALLPIVGCFALFQIFMLKLPKSRLIKMGVGMIYTYLGLVLFLTGVNVGFLQIGNYIGSLIGALDYNWVLIPIGAVMGFFVVMAEPAVHILNKQVEDITVGAISKRAMLISLSCGVAVSIALAMVRVLTGLAIWWIIIPGYAIALALSFFVPKIFTAIAFDSGGVASGPMTAAFMLPFAMGACAAARGSEHVMTDAFGIVAMVAMTPLVTIQILGLVYKIKLSRIKEKPLPSADDEVIEL